MPIKSYLVHPHDGKKDILIDKLTSLNHCEVIPAENKELLILVTDTDSKSEEDILREKLDNLSDIKHLALVSGFNSPKNN